MINSLSCHNKCKNSTKVQHQYSLFILAIHHLWNAEVAEDNPSAAEDENILGLDVAMQHPVGVHVV